MRAGDEVRVMSRVEFGFVGVSLVSVRICFFLVVR